MAVMIEKSTKFYVFAGWTLHDDGRLTGRDTDVQLPPKESSVLRLLLVCAGSLMTKDRLLALAWPSGEVADESLTRCIYALRKHLNADKRFIKTVYGKGYRFTCPVQVQEGEPGQVMHVCAACGQISSV
ncbi:winged helix-turn-helix domain-containing protein [Pseudomonas orientalis]|uniref:winged helix-turn-helix domain-containing protein n=1 Tax=Pseudomonas orientalis TaxID=76758 RepID=UPI000F58C58E|nr:winged helix-turn-helix domain-containing protein [Pseudomonas orientalis]AZE90669.1 Invasion protein iagA [Pseudomonas orientalis]